MTTGMAMWAARSFLTSSTPLTLGRSMLGDQKIVVVGLKRLPTGVAVFGGVHRQPGWASALV